MAQGDRSLFNNLHEPKNYLKLMVINDVYGNYIECLLNQYINYNNVILTESIISSPLKPVIKGHIANTRTSKSIVAGISNTSLPEGVLL